MKMIKQRYSDKKRVTSSITFFFYKLVVLKKNDYLRTIKE